MAKEKKFAEGFCFYKLFWVFLSGCVFGAYYEELLNLVIHYHYHHEWVWQLRRGVIYGPISPIYGVGALLMVLVLGRKERPDWKTFFYGSVLGGTLEYFMSFFQEMFLGTVSWDYTNDFLNIHGRTTIPYAIVWGLLSLVLIKIFYPAISSVVESFPRKFGKILTNTLIIIIILDFFLSWGAILRQTFRHNGIKPISFIGEFFDTYYPDEFLEKTANNTVVIEVDKTKKD